MSVPALNRLAGETSPYLLQHAANPVDWYPWGPEALERARREDRPIFLSVGYSACHWCHVMERESFEDERIAGLLNRHFVSIKVDREERPDVDGLYMRAVLQMTGSGGWPMSVFLTPELEPFWAGTYLPPAASRRGPGFADLVASLAKAWEERREDLLRKARRASEAITREARVDARGEIEPAVLDLGFSALRASFDGLYGGFGDAPKFPHAVDLCVCLRHALRTGDEEGRAMALFSLERMASGGIHDQLAGGFHRYSTDEAWRVPHFEKMLYDNALLVPAYLEAGLASGDARFGDVARRTCEWALAEMRVSGGGFASSQDADSEGAEGRYFVWTPEELDAALGKNLSRVAQEWWDVRPGGDLEDGGSVLARREGAAEVATRLRLEPRELAELAERARLGLLETRRRRSAPARDDKVLAAWNGLMISALARAHQVLDEERYLAAAREAARFVLETMRNERGGLAATARGGRLRHAAGLDDHVFLVQALIDLYESDFDVRWLEEASELADVIERRFADRKRGGYFTTHEDHEPLLARLKSPHDGALPSGNGVHALNLLRMAELFGEERWALAAERTLLSLGKLVNRHPAAFGSVLLAVDFLAAGPREIVVAGAPDAPETRAMLRVVRGRFLPQRVVALALGGEDVERLPLLRGREPGETGARAWVCRNWTCGAPVDSASELERALEA